MRCWGDGTTWGWTETRRPQPRGPLEVLMAPRGPCVMVRGSWEFLCTTQGCVLWVLGNRDRCCLDNWVFANLQRCLRFQETPTPGLRS